MKSTKKLLILLLSLVLLIGAFAVMASAEEAQVATVVYPDGSAVAVAVGSQIDPKPFTDGLYNGEGNTLFKDDATEGWLFTVEGEESALSDLKVTEAMAGKNIIASGADKVYYTITKSGVTTYNTNADTYASDLRNLLRNTTTGQTVRLYSDVTFAATYTYGSSSSTLYLTLNGHTWTITESWNSCALDCSSNIYIYSTAPGGVVDAPDAAYFFRTNDRTIDGTKYYGYPRFGESNLTAQNVNGKNLTVYCNQINRDMYGSNALILGGTYIQHENSKAKYFMLLSRETEPGLTHFNSSNVKEIRNATFIVTKSTTSPIYWTHASTSFTNCSFINTSGTNVSLFADLMEMTVPLGRSVFSNNLVAATLKNAVELSWSLPVRRLGSYLEL